jgi:hypothetical protein
MDKSLTLVRSVFANNGPAAQGQWEPIPALSKNDSDVSIFFVNVNSVLYPEPVNDPLFSAHEPSVAELSSGNLTSYVEDYLVNALACTDQYQICSGSSTDTQGNPTSCTPLGAASSLNTASLSLSLTQEYIATIVINMVDLYQGISTPEVGRGTAALLASDLVVNGLSPALPSNQWQIEVSHWFNMTLALLQEEISQFANGPTNADPVTGVKIVPPTSSIEQAVCRSVKTRSANGHVNFSALGVGIILAIGTTIILLSYIIEPLTYLVMRMTHKGKYRRLQWLMDSTFQLHRVAYESAGWGSWKQENESVPITEEDNKLGLIDQSDPERPVIFRANPKE